MTRLRLHNIGIKGIRKGPGEFLSDVNKRGGGGGMIKTVILAIESKRGSCRMRCSEKEGNHRRTLGLKRGDHPKVSRPRSAGLLEGSRQPKVGDAPGEGDVREVIFLSRSNFPSSKGRYAVQWGKGVTPDQEKWEKETAEGGGYYKWFT